MQTSQCQHHTYRLFLHHKFVQRGINKTYPIERGEVSAHHAQGGYATRMIQILASHTEYGVVILKTWGGPTKSKISYSAFLS